MTKTSSRQESEILAVISAAIAAMEAKPGHKLVVKAFRRIPERAPVWNSFGRVERMRSRLS